MDLKLLLDEWYLEKIDEHVKRINYLQKKLEELDERCNEDLFFETTQDQNNWMIQAWALLRGLKTQYFANAAHFSGDKTSNRCGAEIGQAIYGRPLHQRELDKLVYDLDNAGFRIVKK